MDEDPGATTAFAALLVRGESPGPSHTTCLSLAAHGQCGSRARAWSWDAERRLPVGRCATLRYLGTGRERQVGLLKLPAAAVHHRGLRTVPSGESGDRLVRWRAVCAPPTTTNRLP